MGWYLVWCDCLGLLVCVCLLACCMAEFVSLFWLLLDWINVVSFANLFRWSCLGLLIGLCWSAVDCLILLVCCCLCVCVCVCCRFAGLIVLVCVCLCELPGVGRCLCWCDCLGLFICLCSCVCVCLIAWGLHACVCFFACAGLDVFACLWLSDSPGVGLFVLVCRLVLCYIDCFGMCFVV